MEVPLLDGMVTHKVTLQAKDDSQNQGGVNIFINSDATIAAIEFVASDNTIYKIEVRSINNGLTFAKGTFTFTADNYVVDEVIDMR